LQDVVKTFAKKISIQLKLDDIKNDKIDSIKGLIDQHDGQHDLSFIVYDNEEKIMVEMNSEKQKINISPKLLSDLEGNNIFYKLN
jgi:DNA polymerase-3 subunit alpha